MGNTYQKECKLKDGSVVLLRPLVAQDRDGLITFFQSLPEELRLYLRHDVTDANIIKSWTENINYDHIFPILAFADDRIVGGMILFDLQKYGQPSGHWNLGRMWVDSRFHNQGIGQEAIRQMFERYPEAVCWRLETPEWAIRNHHFYEKAGFRLKDKTVVDPKTGWADFIYECVMG